MTTHPFDELTHLRFVCEVMQLIGRIDANHTLTWRTGSNQNELELYVNVSDVFEWGTFDVEEITPETLPDLIAAKTDIAGAHDRVHHHRAVELYAARRRQQRPQGAWYHDTPAELHPLFDACGPYRAANSANPLWQHDVTTSGGQP